MYSAGTGSQMRRTRCNISFWAAFSIKTVASYNMKISEKQHDETNEVHALNEEKNN